MIYMINNLSLNLAADFCKLGAIKLIICNEPNSVGEDF